MLHSGQVGISWIVISLTFWLSGSSIAVCQELQPKDSSLDRGIDYLMSQLHEDGLWRSEYYGNLKEGAGVSALALYAITRRSPDDWRQHQVKLQKCIDVLARHIEKHGYVSNADGPDYSNYGSAMLLITTRQTTLKLSERHRHQLIRYLMRSQLDADEGYARASADFGGWDLSGWMSGKRKTTGTNISVSACVIDALTGEYEELQRAKKLTPSKWTPAHKKIMGELEKCFQKARIWIQRCGNDDGGFFFHPEKAHQGNKAQWSDDQNRRPNSYGSATADGIWCMVKLRQTAPSKKTDTEAGQEYWSNRISKSTRWILKQGKPKLVPGFADAEKASSWAHGLKYYYWMVLARSASARETSVRDALKHESELAKWIAAEQKKDGSWQNANARMREDDPLIATSFAVIALSYQEERDAAEED